MTDDWSYEMIEEVARITVKATTLVAFASFIVYLGSTEGITSILRDIAMLQNMVYFPAFNILTPANLTFFLGLFHPLVSFKMDVVSQANDRLFNFSPTAPKNE